MCIISFPINVFAYDATLLNHKCANRIYYIESNSQKSKIHRCGEWCVQAKEVRLVMFPFEMRDEMTNGKSFAIPRNEKSTRLSKLNAHNGLIRKQHLL